MSVALYCTLQIHTQTNKYRHTHRHTYISTYIHTLLSHRHHTKFLTHTHTLLLTHVRTHSLSHPYTHSHTHTTTPTQPFTFMCIHSQISIGAELGVSVGPIGRSLASDVSAGNKGAAHAFR